MTLHPKVQEVLMAANVMPESPDIVILTEDPQYWFKLALREVMRGGTADVGYLLQRYETGTSAENKESAQAIEALAKANRIAMAIRCWDQAKKNAEILGMRVKILVESMHKWMEGTDLVPADLDIEPEMIQEVLAAEKE